MLFEALETRVPLRSWAKVVWFWSTDWALPWVQRLLSIMSSRAVVSSASPSPWELQEQDGEWATKGFWLEMTGSGDEGGPEGMLQAISDACVLVCLGTECSNFHRVFPVQLSGGVSSSSWDATVSHSEGTVLLAETEPSLVQFWLETPTSLSRSNSVGVLGQG